MPTIGDILSIGEDRFYKSLSPFLYNSTSIRVFLWDKFNMDWNKVKDIEVFGIMNQILKDEDKEPANIVFKNMSFNDFVIKEAKRHIEDEERRFPTSINKEEVKEETAEAVEEALENEELTEVDESDEL